MKLRKYQEISLIFLSCTIYSVKQLVNLGTRQIQLEAAVDLEKYLFLIRNLTRVAANKNPLTHVGIEQLLHPDPWTSVVTHRYLNNEYKQSSNERARFRSAEASFNPTFKLRDFIWSNANGAKLGVHETTTLHSVLRPVSHFRTRPLVGRDRPA